MRLLVFLLHIARVPRKVTRVFYYGKHQLCIEFTYRLWLGVIVLTLRLPKTRSAASIEAQYGVRIKPKP